MIFTVRLLLLAGLLCTASRAAGPASEAELYWPQWRGPLATGVAPHGDPPVQWDEETNIRWKTPLPGRGHATPVVWEDRIFVLTAVAEGGTTSYEHGEVRRQATVTTEDAFRYEVLAVNRADGRLLWRRTAAVGPPHEGRHADGSWASSSPVTDGEHVIASFGSRGLFCYDMDGNLKWEKDYGDLQILDTWGEGSSPALYGNRLIVPWDHEGQSFVAVVDKHTGKEIWRADREDGTSWATPLVVEHGGRVQVVTSGRRRVRSYDLDTGTVLWETRGMSKNPIPSPVAAEGIVYVSGTLSESILQAISLDDADGDAAAANAILWEHARDASYIASPLLYNGILYYPKADHNILSCVDAHTGELHYPLQRLEGIGRIFASPVAARDRVYFTGRNGLTLVIRHGARFEVLATNQLDDYFDASPAIAGQELYLRGHESLYCIAPE